MIGHQLGPYRIESELGSGGMGTVYRATDDAGQCVAVKIIHPHLLATPGFFKRFLREADLGRRVVHENVVRTLDADALLVDDRQVNFMVMEYVEGKSLRELLTDLGAVPETLLREIARQIAAGLAAIHAEGIVHRDLKPENVLITDDHEIRIMDLGVAKLQEVSIAITLEGQFAGSLLYAAPEQFGAGEVGPSADLYSLGLMLYELASGENPFWRDDAAAVMEAHLRLEPPRITDRSSETTAFFAELVATLLAKNPADRFESAQVLHDVLREAERSRWWRKLAPELRRKVAHLPRIRVRRETRLHGRDDDLETLHEAWGRAKRADGNSVFLEGEAGIGKTRLLDAFLRGLEDEDFCVLYGSYPPSGGLGGISDAILDRFGESNLAGALAPYLTVTPSLVPAFAALMKYDSPPVDAEPLHGEALHAVCVHLMRALAEEKPLLWLVEDLHFAGKEARDTVLTLARATEGHRVLLVATARPGVPDDEIANFSRLENHQRLKLNRLGAREVVHLLVDAFQSDALADKLAGKIARKSDGVPYFIFEMIRGLEEGRFLRRQADGSYVQTQPIDEIEVPSAVKDLIEGRLRGLDDQDRELLDVGSVQGLEFDPDLVAQVLGTNRVQVLRRLVAIERRLGLVRDEGRAIRFDQNQIQEVVYQDLTPHLKAEYHALLARAYAKRLEGESSGRDAVFLASHHLRGSRPQLALPHLAAAFDHLEQGYRNDSLLDLTTCALRVKDLLEEDERVAILLRQAGCLDVLGRRGEERAALDEARALADRTGEALLRGKVHQALGWHLCRTADYDAARATLREALELARAAGDRKLEAQATGSLGGVFVALGREEAQEHHERAGRIAREIGDRRGEMKAAGNLGNSFYSLGRLTEAQEHYDRCGALAREIGDRVAEAATAANVGSVFAVLGRMADAKEHYERGARLAREIGHRGHEAHAIGGLGNVFRILGRIAEAKEHSERANGLFREIGDRLGEANTSLNVGILLALLGCPADAKGHMERGLDIAREIGLRQVEVHALHGLAGLAEAEEDGETATRLYEEALALARATGSTRVVSRALVALGRLDAGRGRAERAEARLAEALALARELKRPDTILKATVERARLAGGNVEAALAALAEHEGRVDHADKMNARFRLWELTNDEAHLGEAHRLLCHLRDHAPEDCRGTMLENVPLHRDIMKAWEEHGS